MSANNTKHDIFRIIGHEAAVNLSFTDLSYAVDEREQSSKIIVNGVSGEFRAGELSAVIGPSGSGKTTLLNLLSGYRIHKTSGHINVNGKPKSLRKLRKISRYVLQEDNISPHFTVMETMMYASLFKLGTHNTRIQCQTAIDEILDIFQLHEQANTLISTISGGQRKRLCIALELLNKPPVLILDEPTTGLDEYSAAQCIRVLKQLAQSGHTVICTIHTPSARLIQMFDKVFVLAEGQCIYQGAVNHIVPYLQKFELICPITYNPIDFVIETAMTGYFHDDLVHEIKNGKVIKWLPDMDSEQLIQINEKDPAVSDEADMDPHFKLCEQRNSWWSEYKWLFLRFMHQMWRDKTNLKLRIFVHVILALIIGGTFLGTGTNAKLAMYNYNFALVVVVYFVFLFMTPVTASVPQEMSYLRREHFNQWYRLSSYFMAFITSQLPIMLTMTAVGSSLMYFLTDQPLQLFRYGLFFVISLLIALMATCYGILIGSLFSIVNALFLGTSIMAVFMNIAYYPTERTHLSLFEKILVYASCMRHCAEGLLATLLCYNRADFICPPSEIICIMSKPQFILKQTGIVNVSYTRSALALIGFSMLFSLLAFVTFKIRLNSYEFFEKNRQYRYIKNKITICLHLFNVI